MSQDKENPQAGFIQTPREIGHNTRLTLLARMLYGEILTLSRQKGYCFASNPWFEKNLGYSKRRIQQVLSELEAAGLIEREYSGGGDHSRKIFPLLGYETDFIPSKGGMKSTAQGYETNFIGYEKDFIGGMKSTAHIIDKGIDKGRNKSIDKNSEFFEKNPGRPLEKIYPEENKRFIEVFNRWEQHAPGADPNLTFATWLKSPEAIKAKLKSTIDKYESENRVLPLTIAAALNQVLRPGANF